MIDAETRPARAVVPRSERPRRSRRSRRTRLARIAVATAAVLVLGVVGTGAWFYQRLDSNITTFDAAGIAPSRPPAPTPTEVGADVPVNVLLLGSDTRNDGNDDLGGGDAGVGHSDTAMLLHVYGDRRHAVAVSIPRDTLVTIPPCRRPDGSWTAERTNQMFNSAFTVGDGEKGNPACTQNTVERLTGLRVDHTIVVDFKGFAAMTQAVNGVDVCVPNAVNSYGIKLAKGRQTVSGQLALDYVRARHGFGDGSDIGRIKRQQAFLSSLIKKVQDQGFNLTTLLPLADAASRSLTVDPGLGTPMKLVDFAQSLREIQLSDIEFVTVPWEYKGSRVALVQPDSNRLFELLRQDHTLDGRATGASPTAGSSATPTPSASASASASVAATPLTVVNASRSADTATRVEAELKAAGWTDLTAGPTPEVSRRATLISYPPTPVNLAEAERLGRLYPDAEIRPDTTVATLTLTLGRDQAAGTDQVAATTSSPSATSTTSSSATPSATPTGIPSGIADNTRTADSDLCSNLTFGDGG
ncbi:LCP family protein [Kitasatospora sp. NPDC096147]|uniref:LCP family protein n=1 Tax=Kitasatospora sp. NPDC096147 TaxID=3364093 RepID=UPI00382F87F0